MSEVLSPLRPQSSQSFSLPSTASSSDHSNASSNSPGENPWTASPQQHMITLSPTAGDQPTTRASDPLQSSSNDEDGMDQMPSGSGMDEIEGVWSADIEQAFQEAMAIYPPCGRRKIILSDEGKMYGRNELIARYIKLRCGKTRTRKQVSSHIQVLTRKKMRETGPVKDAPKSATHSPPSMVPKQEAGVAAATQPSTVATPRTTGTATVKEEPVMNAFEQLSQIGKNVFSGNLYQSFISPFQAQGNFGKIYTGYENISPLIALAQSPLKEQPLSSVGGVVGSLCQSEPNIDVEQDGYQIGSSRLTLCGFSAFVEPEGGKRIEIVSIPEYSDDSFTTVDYEQNFKEMYPPLLGELLQKGPSDAFFLVKCWANMNFGDINLKQSLFAVDSIYQSDEEFEIFVSTKVCTFGSEVINKEEKCQPVAMPNGKFVFNMENSPFCDFMINFIENLNTLVNKSEVDKVLEKFTVIQTVSNRNTHETLLVIAFVFAVSDQPESSCSIFRLINESSASPAPSAQ